MRISSLSLTNFRCFGPEPQTIALGDLTALVGANGSGKSAALQALGRLFGTTQTERSLVRADFHLPVGLDWEDVKSVELRIEARLEFPELAKDGDGAKDAVAACFKHMTVRETGESPHCRIRLDGTWERTSVPEGDVAQKLLWVTTPIGDDEADETTLPVLPHDRSRIHVHYVPALRDPTRQIRQVSGSLLYAMLRAVQWSDETKRKIENASKAIRDVFAGEPGVKQIRSALEECWQEMHSAPQHRHVAITPVARRAEEVVRQVEATFGPGPADEEDGIERLSDGQRSLFYLALVAALLDVHEAVAKSDDDAISRAVLRPPVLNVLAVEEPENHVAPHYLGRIMSVLRRVASSDSGQVVVSSHSASIMSRVDPTEVRHLRTTSSNRTTAVRRIVLPDKAVEQHKFIREAVRAYPELYFAQFVVLGEGDSEEVVIPRLAEAMGVPVDASLVSVVPLGGRHVNHFWQLLAQLEVPHVTLLDLDRERHGGGWGRIRYAIDQLIAAGFSKKELLAIDGEDGGTSVLSAKELAGMHEWDVADVDLMKGWIKALEKRGVFFSAPLDLDFAMFCAFPKAYKASANDADGPDIPTNAEAYADAEKQAVRAVLKGKGSAGSTYDDEERRSFFWYRYLFLGRGKPSTHIEALSKISDEELKEGAPKVLRRLVKRMAAAIAAVEAGAGDAE